MTPTVRRLRPLVYLVGGLDGMNGSELVISFPTVRAISPPDDAEVIKAARQAIDETAVFP